jgi:hypothetical protein
MKKSLIISSLILVSTVLSAKEYVYDGSSYLHMNQPIGDDVVFALDSNGTVDTQGRARFLFNGNAVHSITTDASNKNSNFKLWDLLFTVATVDIKSSSSDVVAFNAQEEVNLKGYTLENTPTGLGELVFTNSATVENGANPFAIVNFTTLSPTYASKIITRTNTRFNGSVIKLADKCGLSIESGTTEWNVSTLEWGGASSFVNISAGATLKNVINKSFMFKKAEIAGSFVNETTSDVIFTATSIRPTNVSGDVFSKGRIKIWGSVNISGSMSYVFSNEYAKNILLARETDNKGNITNVANVTLDGKDVLSRLIVSSEDAYNKASDKSQYIVRDENGSTVYYKKDYAEFVINGYSSNIRINVNADNAFKLFFSSGDVLTLNIASDATLTLAGITNVMSSNPVITINNFENDSIFMFESALEKYDLITDIKAITADGETFNKQDISLVADVYNGQAGYWLTVPALAVPEPAEWAMIFGGIALGLAIYRRRK